MLYKNNFSYDKNKAFYLEASKDPRIMGRLSGEISDTDNCCIWKTCIANGYGRIYFREKYLMVHRVIFFSLGNDLNEDEVVDHMCKVRNCMNPRHLRKLTMKENILVGDGAGAKLAKVKFCKQGHEYTPENTGRHGKNKGRFCKACMKIFQKKYRIKNREELIIKKRLKYRERMAEGEKKV